MKSVWLKVCRHVGTESAVMGHEEPAGSCSCNAFAYCTRITDVDAEELTSG